MKNLKRLTLLCTVSLIFFSLKKTRANSITSTSRNNILPYNSDLPINNNSSPSLGFTFTDGINQHSYMTHSTVCELPGPIPSFRAGPMQCEAVEKSTKCPFKMEALFSYSKVMASATSSSASIAIKTSSALKYIVLALLSLMMPCGIPNDDDDDDEDGSFADSDDDDDDYDSEIEEYGGEGDALVYTYEGNANPRNNQQGTLALITNLYLATTWKEAADSMHDDFIIHYHLEPNNDIAGNPRLCCWGYYARYFQYRDPWSETDAGEPIQEFTLDQNWFTHVKPFINRINLYRMSSNGF